jgi:hypothetical protein
MQHGRQVAAKFEIILIADECSLIKVNRSVKVVLSVM